MQIIAPYGQHYHIYGTTQFFSKIKVDINYILIYHQGKIAYEYMYICIAYHLEQHIGWNHLQPGHDRMADAPWISTGGSASAESILYSQHKLDPNHG